VSLPSEIKILGWSTMAEISAVDPVGGWHEVSVGDMHDLSSLLEWITTGRCPVQPPVTAGNKGEAQSA
jgi:hypothetical protein